MAEYNNHKFNRLSYLLIFSDIFALVSSWIISYLIRFKGPIPYAQTGLDWEYASLLLILCPLGFYYFYKKGLYSEHMGRLGLKEISYILTARAQIFFTFIIFLYFFYSSRVSRLHLISDLGLSTLCLLFGRLLLWKIWKRTHPNPNIRERVFIVGHGDNVEKFQENLRKDRRYEIIGVAKNINDCLKDKSLFDLLVVGFPSYGELQQSFVGHEVDVQEIPLLLLPDFGVNSVGNFYTDYYGIPVIIPFRPPLNKMDYFIKRIFDLLGSVCGLIILSPLLLLITILVKISGKGPIFYGQSRVGLNGEEFMMWKFRSMAHDAESKTGAVWAIENDPRKTKLGNILRKTSLDELPQLYNVLVGNMSLVGPRPERKIFVDKFKHEIPEYALRHKMKTGITGWAQVNGWRGNTDLRQRIQCDLFYIKNWSMWLDIKIIFLTIWKGMINKNAY